MIGTPLGVRARLRAAEAERDQAIAERDWARLLADVTGRFFQGASRDATSAEQLDEERVSLPRWRHEVATLLGIQAEGTLDVTLLDRLRQALEDSARAQQVADERRAELDLAHQAIGRIAATAGCAHAPERWEVDAIINQIVIVKLAYAEAERERLRGVRKIADLIADTAAQVPREALDPAMGGDIEPPPGRPAPTARDRHADGHDTPDGVAHAEIACGMTVDDVFCGLADGHPGGCSPSRRDRARRALLAAGITEHPAAVAQVLDEAHLLADRGMTVDGDVLHEAILDAAPRWMRDVGARLLAAAALDNAVAAGMTVLHGPDLTPRPTPDPASVAEVPF